MGNRDKCEKNIQKRYIYKSTYMKKICIHIKGR